jgi:predicted NAD/FAD-binding protein
MKIAVVGSGISGLLAARLLALKHDVVLYEAGDYLGGHTNTIDVEVAGQTHAVDTGFMVFNERTYPNFCRLLELLQIGKQPSDMSFSVRDEATGLEYCGSSIDTLFAQRTNLFRPKFWRMLAEVVRFNRAMRQLAESVQRQSNDAAQAQTLGEFLRLGGYSSELRQNYILPMASAIWSCPAAAIEQFPAAFLAKFFHNHGLLDITNRPQWLTVAGTARSYVQALVQPLEERIELNKPVERIERGEQGVRVCTANAPRTFDAVVLAVHSDTALRLIAEPTESEQQILGAIKYQANTAVVHHDVDVLPRTRRAWASWNAHVFAAADQPACVTYWLNRLQRFESTEPICVTLGLADRVRPDKVLRTIEYQHPVYSHAAVAAQRRWSEISGTHGIYYCGAYWRNGFHEDGVVSALNVAQQLGLSLEDLPGGTNTR